MEVGSAAAHKNRLGQGINREAEQSSAAHLVGGVLCRAARGQDVDRIHVHHGYFGSWIGMTAARLLNAGFSMTLHGSDLLRNAAYLDLKLGQCDFCVTISDYNRDYILQRSPNVDPHDIVVSRLGVDVVQPTTLANPHRRRIHLTCWPWEGCMRSKITPSCCVPAPS